MYFSAAAIGFAWTSGRRRSVASDGRRGGGGGKLVAGRATTRGRGATRAAALGAAALQAKRSQWRGIITGELQRSDAFETLRRHFDQYRCASDAPAALTCKPTQSPARASGSARMPARRAVDWSRGLLYFDIQANGHKRRPRARPRVAAKHRRTPRRDRLPRDRWDVSRIALAAALAVRFNSDGEPNTKTKFVGWEPAPCAAAGQPQTAPWTLPRRSAPPRHPAGCRRGTRCRQVQPL